jgi:hypothetical protein
MAKPRKRKPKRKKVNKKLTKKAVARKKVNPRKAKAPKKPAPTQRKPSERGGPAPTKVPTKVRVSEFGAVVNSPPRRPSTALRRSPFPASVVHRAPQVHAPETKKRKRKRALSRNPDAVRARKYRRERRAIADALEAEREEKLEARRIRDRERRRQKREPKGPASREVAELWLRAIRDDFAHGTETTLEIVPDPGGGGPWLISGLFSFLEPLSYAELGEALQYLQDDLILTARINPSRLTRLHILFVDPHDTRGRAGNIVSKISGYEYAIGDAITEILGGRSDDENALAVRYEDTTIGELYVSFAATVVQYRTAFPTGPQTVTIKL